MNLPIPGRTSKPGLKAERCKISYSHLPDTSPGRDNSQGREIVENQGLNSSQGWVGEKNKGRTIDKGG